MSGRGPALQTYLGFPFFVEEPRPEDVTIEDIAHALSNQCRFNGHCRPFYSVAQHSVHVAHLVEKLGGGADVQLQALLHDAAEAYIGDMPTPIKRILPEFLMHEERIWQAIAVRLSVPVKLNPLVKMADRVALATERRDLMAPTTKVEWDELPAPDSLTISPLSPGLARWCFEKEFRRLNGLIKSARRAG